MSRSVRPRHGRISASRPWRRCERLSFVATCTVSAHVRQRCLGDGSVSGVATAKLPPRRDEDVDLAVAHRPNRVDGVAAVLAWRLEAELLAQLVEERVGHLLPDAHRPVALHVAVPADRARPGARAADVAAQQQEVDDLADGGHRVAVLGQAHRPAHDDPLGGAHVGGNGLDLVAAQAALRFDARPVERTPTGDRRRRSRWCSAR